MFVNNQLYVTTISSRCDVTVNEQTATAALKIFCQYKQEVQTRCTKLTMTYDLLCNIEFLKTMRSWDTERIKCHESSAPEMYL